MPTVTKFNDPANTQLVWCCVDCMILLANGETSGEWTEQETAEFVARFDAGLKDSEPTLGMFASEHADDCTNVDRESGYLRGEECDCEENSFSWSPCGICRSSLGGSRHAVTLWF